ncbi:hypothetical protein T06_16577 [Trichinella sp. T6]|nr:hypothetical protein T06_16577 [Trichinella sp. T6]
MKIQTFLHSISLLTNAPRKESAMKSVAFDDHAFYLEVEWKIYSVLYSTTSTDNAIFFTNIGGMCKKLMCVCVDSSVEIFTSKQQHMKTGLYNKYEAAKWSFNNNELINPDPTTVKQHQLVKIIEIMQAMAGSIYTGKFVELEGGLVFNSVLTLFDSFCDLNILVKYMLRLCA